VPPVAVEWRWHPVSIDILLNLQAGRDPWAAYVDPLAPPKRRHLVTDVRRSAAFYGAPLAPPFVPRPDSAPALCAALVLDQSGIRYDAFLMAVFDEMWCRSGNIGAHDVLANCLRRASVGDGILEQAVSDQAKGVLAAHTVKAYNDGIFGVPSFVFKDEVFFGADRLDMLGWRMPA
jgi:2-hydroxychromene-2-carboxylate isomerase